MGTSDRRRLPLIYIVGPFRGPTPLDVRLNVEHARTYGLIVAKAGGYPIIPHTMTADFDKQLDDQFWLDGTMEMLSRCDAIALIPHWRLSTGARAEKDAAEVFGLPEWDFTALGQNNDEGLADWIAAIKPGRLVPYVTLVG